MVKYFRRGPISLVFVGIVCTAAHSGKARAESKIEGSSDSLAAWQYKFSPDDEALLDKIEEACFRYFWNEVRPPALLVKDNTTDSVSSVAAVGFQLSSLPIGVERGWITRDQGTERARAVLRALVTRTDNKKHGIYLHYLAGNTGGPLDRTGGQRQYELQASTIDHALLQAGAMTAAVYFKGEIARLAEKIAVGADWPAMYDDVAGWMTHGWRASTNRGVDGPGEIRPHHWLFASDEERLISFLAVGAPHASKAIEPQAYYRLQRVVKRHESMPEFAVSWNGSLFTYFFAHCWIDYRHLAADDPAAFGQAGPRVDWFENSRRAVLTHRARCIEASSEYPTLGPNRWGLAPCEFAGRYLVADVKPNVSDQDRWLDGIVPPYAAGAALMFAPAESMAALREFRSLKKGDGTPLAWRDPASGAYGFVDAFRLSPAEANEANFGINVGPLLLGIENARSGLIWRLFMEHDVARRAVERLRLRPR
jgi:hypothetical protein